MVRALVVACTLWSITTHQRIATVPIGTVTPGIVIVVRPAVRIRTALCVLARIDAVPVNAGFRRRTVAVAAATDLVASELRITGVTFAAGTDRSVELYPAFGVLRAQAGTDGARILALSVDARLIIRTLAIAGTLGLRGLQWRLLITLYHTLHER
uniref:Putative secreted protein n=1 Tax=Anopheles darlingi TaxID=43151 RepID=A0A2M4DEN3_ANODA